MINIHTKVFAQNVEPNTFIGGIAKIGDTGVNAPIDTRSLLATKLGINASRISAFKIIGNNVQCRIKGTYGIPNYAFKDNTNIKTFIDGDNLVTTINRQSFNNSTELENIQFYGLTTIASDSVFYKTKLKDVYFPLLTSYSYTESVGTFKDNLLLETVNIPLATIGMYVYNSPLLYEYYAPLITTFYPNALRNNIGLTAIGASSFLPHLTSVSTSCFSGAFVIDTDLVLPLVTSVGGEAFGGGRIRSVVAPNLITATGSRTWFGGTRYELIDIKKCINIGGNGVTNRENFGGLKVGCTINVNIALLTCVSGSPNTDLLHAKDVRGAIVNFYDDAGVYVSTL